jgi:exodeoxyribonuclease V gamma subunit
MADTDAEAQQEILDALTASAEALGEAVAALGVAYEQLDELRADQLEERLFRPVQRALGRAKRTHAEFAARHDLPTAGFGDAALQAPSTGVKGLIDSAVESVRGAEAELVALQDSFLPVEFGDVELRAGLSEVRELIGGVPEQAREFVRTFGR